MATALTVMAGTCFVVVLIVGAAVIGFRAGRQAALDEVHDELLGLVDDLSDAGQHRSALSRLAGATDTAEVR